MKRYAVAIYDKVKGDPIVAFYRANNENHLKNLIMTEGKNCDCLPGCEYYQMDKECSCSGVIEKCKCKCSGCRLRYYKSGRRYLCCTWEKDKGRDKNCRCECDACEHRYHRSDCMCCDDCVNNIKCECENCLYSFPITLNCECNCIACAHIKKIKDNPNWECKCSCHYGRKNWIYSYKHVPNIKFYPEPYVINLFDSSDDAEEETARAKDEVTDDECDTDEI